MTARFYNRPPVQNRMDFWDNIGPTSYIKRLDHPEPEMGDRPLLTEETTVVEQRLARGRIDPERTRTEAKHVSEDNAIPDLLLEVNRLELRRMLTELGLSEEVIRSLSDPNRLRSFIAKLIVLRKLLPLRLIKFLQEELQRETE